MTTEVIQPDYAAFDTWSLEQRLDALVAANRRAVAAVEAALPYLEKASEGIKRQLLAGGRLIYIGAGTSGRLAVQDAAELEPTFGFTRTQVLLAGGDAAGKEAQEGAEDNAEAAEQAVRQASIQEKDAVIAIAASGRTPYTVAGLKAAREAGAFTVGIANNPGTPLLEHAHIPILIETGPEVIAGSTRMAAGTAQKIVLNALSTAPMPELGHVYKNLMVGMRPANDKLVGRAVNIVCAAVNADRNEARAALEAAEWRIPQAIVMLGAKVDAEESRRLLERHKGDIRKALGKS